MPKIPFPDIPNVPGVSSIPVNTGNIIPTAVDLSVTNIISAIRSGSFLSAYQTLLGLRYGIYKNGLQILEVDTVMEINTSNTAQISDFPVEGGAFSSYNKVSLPSAYTLNLIKTNSLIGSSKTDVINILQSLLRPSKPSYLLNTPTFGFSEFLGSYDNYGDNNAQFVDVVTPAKAYANVQLESYSIEENNEDGVALMITTTFREIMQPIDASDSNPFQADCAGIESLGEMIGRNFNEATQYVKDSATKAVSAIRGFF